MLILQEKHFIGKGRERTVYMHPQNKKYCIKIANEQYSRSQRVMLREIKYLIRHQDFLKHLSRYHHEVVTNFGRGFVFDLIRDYDGHISKTLEFYIKQSNLRKINHLEVKIDEIFQDLLERKAVVHDLKPHNILIQWSSNNNYKLIIVDGFGNSDFIKICDYSRRFALAKLVRKFNRLKKIIER